MTDCECPLLRSLLGVKRTSLVAAQMSASDPKADIKHTSHNLQLFAALAIFFLEQSPDFECEVVDLAQSVRPYFLLTSGHDES